MLKKKNLNFAKNVKLWMNYNMTQKEEEEQHEEEEEGVRREKR